MKSPVPASLRNQSSFPLFTKLLKKLALKSASTPKLALTDGVVTWASRADAKNNSNIKRDKLVFMSIGYLTISHSSIDKRKRLTIANNANRFYRRTNGRTIIHNSYDTIMNITRINIIVFEII